MKIAAIILAALAAILILLALVEQKKRKKAAQAFPCPGVLVDVGGRKMHVHVVGEGPRTVVMLPGLGTSSPDIDFRPLTRRLEGYRVAIPEPLGYGWSDDTPEPRDADRIIDEIRTGLRAAGVEPPYLLLGHSVAGLYLRRWACRYPDEAEGLILDDPSLPEQAEEAEMMQGLPDHGRALTLLRVASALNRFGLGRIWTRLSEPGYTVFRAGGDMAALPAVLAQAAEKWNDRAVLGEYVAFRANAKAAGEAFPRCPILMFVANGPASCGAMTFKSGFSWVDAHRKTAERAVRGRCVVLPGGHYLHWMFPDRMAEEIRAFYPPEA